MFHNRLSGLVAILITACLFRPSQALLKPTVTTHYRRHAYAFRSFWSDPLDSKKFASASHALAAVGTTAGDMNSNDQEDDNDPPGGLRGRLRQMTGFSLTAFRASVRAITGVSLTAVYAATLAATGAWIRQLTKAVLSIFPPPLRYFLQPFLILYYAPLFILKNLTGPTRRQARKSHEDVVQGWKAAVQKAEDKVSYWPIHVDETTGEFESDMSDSLKLEDGIAESVIVAMETEKSDAKDDDDDDDAGSKS